ncbi:fatty acid-binding protein-like [Onthophagus taurus]|uniref:fatty acid-binding protein-like n=1 Tax=Onthophagus taurus TaxID=166361 RepID=UPI000C1FF580|nr:fatty acid-binding protein type 2-like [Onthophagus taurus]
MVQIAGKYTHDRNENFEAYMQSFGPLVTPEVITQYVNSKPTIEVKLDGNNCTISSSGGQTQSFTFGQAYKDDLFAGHDIESTATLNGNKIEIKTVSKKSGNSGARIYEFSDEGLVIHYTGGVEAKRFYKRA